MADSKLANYVVSLLSLVRRLQEDLQNINNYKISDVCEDANKLTILKIQITGKNSHFLCYPNEVIAHDGFLDGFSKKDIRTITYLATKELANPSVQILSHHIDPQTNKHSFELINKTKGEILLRSASEISKTSALIDKMSARDATIIGYTICNESHELEIKERADILSEDK